ncbi:hypothetical protein SUNI508_12943 [Seiridium unicorne]|uniref:Uncharacterized protein n=1 Tax=Seiridium unicorne TaxID=138068 RepID=A0ABR2VF00_9PEZI
MAQTGTRPASHADAWYEEDPAVLSRELDEWLAEVPDTLDNQSTPIPGARVVIAPHAGYLYSGPCAAWAYKSLDLSKSKRIFVLGPSHRYYLKGCALTRFAAYATPLGDLVVDKDVTKALRDTGKFSDIRVIAASGSKEETNYDVEEHSLEMHLPYIYKRCSQTFSSAAEHPTIIPILVGDNNSAEEKAFGELLAPYLKDPDNAFVISSDFCHWGRRFGYSPYKKGAPIHEYIKDIDHQAMHAIEGGKHDDFVGNLAETGNTVCGRHPIGVTLAALEVLAKDHPDQGKYRFKFVQYDRNDLVNTMNDSSVSYASAYAVAGRVRRCFCSSTSTTTENSASPYPQMSSEEAPGSANEDTPLLAAPGREIPTQHTPPAQVRIMAILSTLAAVYGGTAVALGAFGAHGLKKRIADPQRLQNWNTAAQYQLIHSVATLVVASLAPQTRTTKWAGGLFIAGMTMFSGSLYFLTIDPQKYRAMGPVTPLGGLCFIAGWAALAVGSRGRLGLGVLGGR